jgi:anti-sigma B factor antagonist
MVFKFEFERVNDTGLYKLSGNLIGESYGMALMDSFSEQTEEGIRHFVLDLSQMEHINSSGLGVLITLLTKVRKKDGEMALVNPSKHVRNLLMITKLNAIFQCFDSLDEAIKKMPTS